MQPMGSKAARAEYDRAVDAVRAGTSDPDAAADALIGLMTDDELLAVLDGDAPWWQLPFIPLLLIRRPFVAGAIPRLGIPGIRFSDGARGVVIGASTAFPVTMARAATWDPELEERVGRAIGLETRARGANYSASVCINLLRHPAWGRAQECYGEDPVLTGRMGSAMTRGVRANVMACVKHFALSNCFWSVKEFLHQALIIISYRFKQFFSPLGCFLNHILRDRHFGKGHPFIVLVPNNTFPVN